MVDDASSAVASSIQFNGGGGHLYQYYTASCGISVRGEAVVALSTISRVHSVKSHGKTPFIY
jgi:hypothetical protein